MSAKIAFAVSGIILMAIMMLEKAPMAALAEPEVTEANPGYGEVLATLPDVFHLCFTEPVKTEETNDWRFNVVSPKGQALGLRIVFEPDGGCVDVYPGAPEEPVQGIWTFDWLVHAQAESSEGAGSIKFQLGELQPGETPLEKPESAGRVDDGDGIGSEALIPAVAAGAALIIAGAGGFMLSRLRRVRR